MNVNLEIFLLVAVCIRPNAAIYEDDTQLKNIILVSPSSHTGTNNVIEWYKDISDFNTNEQSLLEAKKKSTFELSKCFVTIRDNALLVFLSLGSPALLLFILYYFACNIALTNFVVGNVEKSTYKAAIFQHVDPSNSKKTHQDIMLESLLVYQQQITLAAQKGVNIIVFPEYGITGLKTPSSREGMLPILQVLPSVIPDPKKPLNPCLQPSNGSFNTTILLGLSCAAMANNIIVVVNIPTIVECNSSQTTCPADGAYQFNTDVVFSQNGTILTYYHKINLFSEPTFNTPPYPPEYVSTFSTSYTTFGLITCFDILFQHPLITMVTKKNVSNVIMSTAWFDRLPFLTSAQTQESFAIGLNINLLASNIQKSSNGNRGGGIYSGSLGYLNYTFSPIDTNLLLISDVPIVPGNSVSKISSPLSTINYPGIFYANLSNFSFVQLFANNSLNLEGKASVNNGNISCSVSYRFDKIVDVGDYFVSAYDGPITYKYDTYVVHVQICTMFWCRNPTDPINTCSRVASKPPQANLEQLSITAKLDTNYVYPNILRHDLQLTNKNDWTFSKSSSKDSTNDISKTESVKFIAELSTKETFSEKILVGSLYGRKYDWDPKA